MTIKTIFKQLSANIKESELAYDIAWLGMLNYKGSERMEVVALENALQCAYDNRLNAYNAFDNTYYALPK
ncbi:MAG: hypothetical protein P8P29_08490 [Flavobacteriaceae bacterium]|nr:hypothetical protein [Flavobacteriaceae bacterium]